MGISEPPSTSMRALSTPSISSALSRCSTPWKLQYSGAASGIRRLMSGSTT